MAKLKQKVAFEGELNLFIKLVKVVKENPVSVVLTLLLIFLTGAMYLQFQLQQAQIDKIQSAVAPDEHSIVIDKFESDKQIDRVLTQTRDSLDADRVKLFQYHNSQRSVNGISFLFISATNEVRKPGVSSEISNLQRLPSVVFNQTLESYFSNKSLCFKRDDLTDGAARQLLVNQGIWMSCNYPVLSDQDIVGIITLNFNSEKKIDTEKIREEMRITSIRVSDALSSSKVE